MDEYYLLAIKAAIEAGKEVLEIYNTYNFDVELKDDNSPLTIADKKSHKIIESYLIKTKYPILSEEGKLIDFEERKKWDVFWLVDPLDGTKEFIQSNVDFTVNIALINNKKPIFGVVYIPFSDELFLGILNKGSFKVQKASQISFGSLETLLKKAEILPKRIDRDFTIVASKSHMNKQTEDYILQVKNKHPKVKFISRGSSLKFCVLAEGFADLYPRLYPTMEWDTAAGQAVLEAVGFKVLQLSGKPLTYNKKDLLNPFFIASNIV